MDHLCYGCSYKKEKQEEIMKENAKVGSSQIKNKQLLLGLSEIGYLTLIVPLPEDTSSSKEAVSCITQDRLSTSEAFILRMPNELISKILTLVTVRPSNEWLRNHYEHILPLATVCRRFYHIASPLLYQTAIFENSCSIVPPCLPARKFHRTMQEKPMLRPYVKAVEFYISDLHHIQSLDEYDIANDFMTWFPNVTSFKLQAGFANGKRRYTWPMIAKGVKHMPSIREISLHREDFDGLLICDVIENLNIPSLRKLDIDGISGYTHPENDFNYQFKSSHFGESPAKGYQRTGSLTSLTLSDFMVSPSDLAILLAWPAILEHFTFERIHSNRAHWELSMFESLLAPHCSVLKSISIGYLTSHAGSINVSAFPELTTLELSRWGWECSPEQAVSNLLAPKLEKFTWDFGVYDQHSESWGDFAQPQVDWLLSFARLASVQKSALKEIVIRFQPDEWSGPGSREQYEAVGYPWDSMDQLALTMKPLGIALSYTPNPSHTKVEVEKIIEQVERRKKKPDIRRFMGDW